MSIFSNDESDVGYSRHLVADSGNPLGGGDGFSRSAANSVAEHPYPQPPPPAPVRASPTSASAISPSRGGFQDVATSGGLASPSFPNDDREIDDSKCKYGKVTVGEPTLVKGRFEVTGHHEFKVSCSSAIVEHVSRRYSDFVWLRSVLVKAFPGIFIAPLPPKSLLGSKGDSFVEGRRIDLQRWLARIVTRPFLADHQAVELFLQKATSAFESDQKELTKAVENQTCGQTIATYKELFPEILRLGSVEDAEVAMETLAEFIKQSESKLNALVGATEKFVKINHEGVQDLAKVTSFFQQAFELEKGFVRTLPTSMASQPILPRVDLNDAFTAWQLSMKWSSNAYDELFLAPFNYEHQDIQAMQELMKNYSELASRHKKSVAKAQKWLEPKNAPKNEKQEAQKFADDAQARDEGVLLDLVSKLIIHAQFEQFWTFRMVQFRKRLHRFAKHQMEATKQLHDNWAQIAAATVGQEA